MAMITGFFFNFWRGFYIYISMMEMIVDKESSWQPAGLVCLIHTMDSPRRNNINNNIKKKKKKYHMEAMRKNSGSAKT